MPPENIGSSSPGHPRPQRPHEDSEIEEKIRKFYKFWAFFIHSGSKISSKDISIEMTELSPHEQQHYGFREVYNVSGILAEGYYTTANMKHEFEDGKLVIASETIPEAYARSEPLTKRRDRDVLMVEEKWAEGRKQQANPVWQQLGNEGKKKKLAKWFCFPRCMISQPRYDTNYRRTEVRVWLSNYNKPYNPYKKEQRAIRTDHWMQLPGGPDEERKKGSPSSAAISVLQLDVKERNFPLTTVIKSVLVVFRIFKKSDGVYRPWRTGDPLVPELWPSPPPSPFPPLPSPSLPSPSPRPSPQPLSLLGTREPPFELSQQTLRGSGNLADYRSRLFPPPPRPLSSLPIDPASIPEVMHPNIYVGPPGRVSDATARAFREKGTARRGNEPESYSLTHRQRKIYDQDFARGSSKGRFANI